MKTSRRSLNRAVILGLLIFLHSGLSACAAPKPVEVKPVLGLPQGTDSFPWWNDSIFYEVFVRSFYDSDGDGIGDLKGLIEKLDYLNDGDPHTNSDLGVSGLWLMPVHPASSYHGYDVTDYFQINPDYGTIEDFQRLLQEAHRRGMRVLIDLVLNHTSSQHPWFIASQEPNSPYRDWYVWSETEPRGSGWYAGDHGYYLGIFDDGMPDLNYRNPAVDAQMLDVARFWLEEVGVDGFRLDAAKHIVEEGTILSHSASNHAWLAHFRSYVVNLKPEMLILGEVWDNSVAVSQYLNGDELHLAFDFDLAQAILSSVRVGSAEALERILARDLKLFPTGQFASFLSNHDQDRTMLVVGDDLAKARLAAGLLLTLPGVPFLYYGEEIGMVGKKPDEWIRTPMQWSSGANAGFTAGVPWEMVNPDYPQKNVEAQLADNNSLLSAYRALIRLRQRHAALRVGETLLVQTSDPAGFAFLRFTPDEVVLVVINLGKQALPDVRLDLSEGPLLGKLRVARLYSSAAQQRGTIRPPQVNSSGGFDEYRFPLELPGNSIFVLQLLPEG